MVAVLLGSVCVVWSADQESVQPYAANPYYWQFRGKPQLLIGGSSDDNLFQLEEAALIRELDRLQAAGVNYLRNTLSSRDTGNRWPFAKQGELYNLEQWDVLYWQRLETFLRETARRDMVVQIELWDPFDYHRDNWRDLNPFNPLLNQNYTAEQSGLPEVFNSHPADRSVRHPFFRSVLPESHLDLVLDWQRRWVDKVLDYTLNYPHVLYCISNETTATPAWGIYWADFIRQRADNVGRTVRITEMWNDWDMRASQHRSTFDHPERYDFVDLSQNTHNSGQEHADGILWVRSHLSGQPRPMNAVKIYGSQQRNNSEDEALERFWRNLFCGMAASRFHRPDSGLGGSEKALHHVAMVHRLLEHFDFFTAQPASQLLGDRRSDEAYAMAAEGAMAIYFPLPEPPLWWEESLARAGLSDELERSVSLSGDSLSGRAWQIAWLSPEHPVDLNWQPLPAGTLELVPPGEGHWIALLRGKP